jgi:hypothetical protein
VNLSSVAGRFARAGRPRRTTLNEILIRPTGQKF